MSRTLTINASNTAPIKARINVKHGETLALTLTPADTAMSLTISDTTGGAPLVEILSEAGGSQFIITPAKVSTLTEGTEYQMNIWNVADTTDLILLVEGTFATLNTILPTFSDIPSQSGNLQFDGEDLEFDAEILTFNAA